MTALQPYVRACGLAELRDTGVVGVVLGGEPVVVVEDGGEVFALRDVCSHAEVPLSDGDVHAGAIECSAHGSCFDLRTGAPTRFPARRPVPTYPVRVDGDDVLVRLGPAD